MNKNNSNSNFEQKKDIKYQNINNNSNNELMKIKSSNDSKNSVTLKQYCTRILNSKQQRIKNFNKKDKKCISVIGRKITNSKIEKISNFNPSPSKSQNITKNIIKNNKMTSYNQKNNIKNYNFNDEIPSGSTMAFSKKFNSNSINSHNLTEKQNNKLRIGLLSAYSNSSNNIIIPILPLQRPLSNFNLGVGQMIDNIDNGNINKNTFIKIKNSQKNQKVNINQRTIKNNVIERKNEDMRNQIRTAPGMKRVINRSNFEGKEKKFWNISNNNFLMSNYAPKFHHIKIDKSLMNNKLADTLKKNIILNYINLDRNKLPKIHDNSVKKYGSMRNYSSIN